MEASTFRTVCSMAAWACVALFSFREAIVVGFEVDDKRIELMHLIENYGGRHEKSLYQRRKKPGTSLMNRGVIWAAVGPAQEQLPGCPSFVRKLTKVDSRAIEESLKWSERTPAPHLPTNRLLESKCFSRVHSRRAAGGNERCA